MNSGAQKELLEFLNNAIAVETDVATQEKIVAEYDIYMAERKPILKHREDPERPDYNYRGSFKSEDEANLFITVCVGSFILLLFIGLCCISISYEILIGLGTFGALFLIPIPFVRRELNKYKSEYALIYEQYRKQKEDIRKENDENQKAYISNNSQWNNSYQESKSVLDVHLSQTRGLLTKLYEKDVVYPKYCTLPALTSIYEYFVTGRCKELTGPNGAYNMYENEVRKDTVIAQLNTVIENLEKIRQNQYMLYQQVKAIQENTDAITAELHQIKGYTIAITQLSALNTYYTALNERNNRIMMYYHL